MKSKIYIEISVQRSILKNEIMTAIWVKIKMPPPITKANEPKKKKKKKKIQDQRPVTNVKAVKNAQCNKLECIMQ